MANGTVRKPSRPGRPGHRAGAADRAGGGPGGGVTDDRGRTFGDRKTTISEAAGLPRRNGDVMSPVDITTILLPGVADLVEQIAKEAPRP
jgi:hypothetical protein